MATKDDNAEEPGFSIHALLGRIRDGTIDPDTLPKGARQAAVEALLAEGYGVPAIAQLLRRSDRTIKRDVEEIVARNALSPDPELARHLVGEIVWRARLSHAHLTRIARSKEAIPSEKVHAEISSWRVLKELIERLQSLGYLPSKGVDAVALGEDVGPELTIEEAKEALARLEEIGKEFGTLDAARRQRIEAVRHRIELAEIGREVAALKKDDVGSDDAKEKEEPHA